MPISLDPQATVDVSLESDAGKPPDARPTFLCRFLTVKAHLRVGKLLRDAAGAGEADKANGLLTEALSLCVAGWRNMGGHGDYSPDKLDEVLTVSEKWELAAAASTAPTLSEQDRKGSASPSEAGTVDSATVPTASAPPEPATR